MIHMHLGDAAAAIGARMAGDNRWFEGVSTDTRTLTSGGLFCALRGPKFDGHDHLKEAQLKGACGVIVDRDVDTTLPTLTVDNARYALGALARAWRRQFAIPVVGVTGSSGKTTVTEMIAAILRTNAPTLATDGNLNNDIGVPKMLFQLDDRHEFAVIEMGANHVGEIEWLTQVAQPMVGVITLCAPSHLEGFGSIERIAQAKSELYAGLLAGGSAVINADDDFADYWREIARGHRVVRFGLKKSADVFAANISNCGIGNGMHFTLRTPTSCIDVKLPFDGVHNVSNALAAAAVAFVLNIEPPAIKSGLESARNINGRLSLRIGLDGSRIIDDTYNANPASLAAAVDVLASVPGERWLVLGDMGELGADAAELHAIAGRGVRDAGIERFYTFGYLAEKAAVAFGDGAEHFATMDTLIEALNKDLHNQVTLLIKGSRSAHMERVIDALVEERLAC